MQISRGHRAIGKRFRDRGKLGRTLQTPAVRIGREHGEAHVSG